MYRRWISSALALLLSIVLSACTTATTQQSQAKVTNTNETSNTDVQPSPKVSAKRVVALSSLAADIIYQLDQTKLIGITGSKLFNDDPKFQDIPRVSEGQSPPNLEKIVSLQPDLVIGTAGFSDVPIQKLKQLGIATYLTQVKNWESLEKLTQTLGQFIGVDSQPLLNRYKNFLSAKAERSRTAKPNENPSTLVLVSRQPILAPNKNSWAGDLLAKFGAKNLAAELQGKSPIGGYVTLSAEKILEANPEVIILVSPPQGGSEAALLESFKKEAFWQKIQATKNNRIYVFDYYGLVNPGSINTIEKAAQQLKQVLSEPR